MAQKRIRAIFKDHEISANTLSFSPNGRFLVTGGNGAVRLWSLRDGSFKKFVRTFQGHTVRNLYFIQWLLYSMHIHRTSIDQCPFRPMIDGLPLAHRIQVFEFGIHTPQNGSVRCMDTVSIRERLLLARRASISRVEQRTVWLDFGDTILEFFVDFLRLYSLKL